MSFIIASLGIPADRNFWLAKVAGWYQDKIPPNKTPRTKSPGQNPPGYGGKKLVQSGILGVETEEVDQSKQDNLSISHYHMLTYQFGNAVL